MIKGLLVLRHYFKNLQIYFNNHFNTIINSFIPNNLPSCILIASTYAQRDEPPWVPSRVSNSGYPFSGPKHYRARRFPAELRRTLLSYVSTSTENCQDLNVFCFLGYLDIVIYKTIKFNYSALKL
jgi:hypothetical protein